MPHPDSFYLGFRWWDDHEVIDALDVLRPIVHYREEDGSSRCGGVAKRRSVRWEKVNCPRCKARVS